METGTASRPFQSISPERFPWWPSACWAKSGRLLSFANPTISLSKSSARKWKLFEFQERIQGAEPVMRDEGGYSVKAIHRTLSVFILLIVSSVVFGCGDVKKTAADDAASAPA